MWVINPSQYVVGSEVGSADADGAALVLGDALGSLLGAVLGAMLGSLLGDVLGGAEGCNDKLGVLVGCAVGSDVGSVLGDMLGSWKHCTNGTPSTTAEFGIWASSLAMIAALFEFASSSNPSGNTIAWPVSLIVLIACSSGSRSFRSSNI